MDYSEKDYFIDKKYQYPFNVHTVEKLYHLCTLTEHERLTWLDGFKLLFAFRSHYTAKYNNKVALSPVIGNIEVKQQQQ